MSIVSKTLQLTKRIHFEAERRSRRLTQVSRSWDRPLFDKYNALSIAFNFKYTRIYYANSGWLYLLWNWFRLTKSWRLEEPLYPNVVLRAWNERFCVLFKQQKVFPVLLLDYKTMAGGLPGREMRGNTNCKKFIHRWNVNMIYTLARYSIFYRIKKYRFGGGLFLQSFSKLYWKILQLFVLCT